MLLGSDSIPDSGQPSASIESELRFYSVWWIGAGVFIAWLASRIEERTRSSPFRSSWWPGSRASHRSDLAPERHRAPSLSRRAAGEKISALADPAARQRLEPVVFEAPAQ
jgi:hypothetical protein